MNIPIHVDLGDKRCINYNGILKIIESKCCGGSHTRYRAVVNCAVSGEIVVGKTACNCTCKNYRKISSESITASI